MYDNEIRHELFNITQTLQFWVGRSEQNPERSWSHSQPLHRAAVNWPQICFSVQPSPARNRVPLVSLIKLWAQLSANGAIISVSALTDVPHNCFWALRIKHGQPWPHWNDPPSFRDSRLRHQLPFEEAESCFKSGISPFRTVFPALLACICCTVSACCSRRGQQVRDCPGSRLPKRKHSE